MVLSGVKLIETETFNLINVQIGIKNGVAILD
jgi:hypothetical protein